LDIGADILQDLQRSGRMKIDRVEDTQEGRKYSFLRYSREDFVSLALVIRVDKNSVLQNIFVNSAELGTAEIDAADGLVSCHSWENEDSAREVSALARRYPIILHNGSEDGLYARKIIEQVTLELGDEHLKDLVFAFCAGEQGLTFDAEAFSTRARDSGEGISRS